MADFVQQSITKTAVRAIATPIANAAAIKTIADTIVSTNPFGCTSYEVGGVTMDPVTITRQTYGAQIAYEDDDAKTVGYVNIRAPTTAAFATMKSEVLGDAEMTAAMDADPVNLAEKETYSITLRCHDPSGETYYLTLSRDRVRLSSYSDDDILSIIEGWADTVPALA